MQQNLLNCCDQKEVSKEKHSQLCYFDLQKLKIVGDEIFGGHKVKREETILKREEDFFKKTL